MEARLNTKPKALPQSFTTANSGVLQRKCACGESSSGIKGECEGCDKQKLSLQRSALNSERSTPDSDGVRSIVQDVLHSRGEPLNAETRAFMEPRFGHDFANVRVHTDSRASQSAAGLNALAYTSGSNIVFGDQQYAPQTSAGSKLIAHELAHVIQQSSQAQDDFAGRDDLEREAQVAADGLDSAGVPEISAGAAPAGAPQLTDAEEVPQPTAQEYITQHTNWLGFNLEEDRLGADLYVLAAKSSDQYQFILDVLLLLDAGDQVEVVEAFVKQTTDAFVKDLALQVKGRTFLSSIVGYLPEKNSQRVKVEKVVAAGPQNEREKERIEAMDQLQRQGKNADITMYTSYPGEDLAESQLKSIAEHQKSANQTDIILPMAMFEDIQGYLEELYKQTKATDFVRELHLMGHGAEDNFGFGQYFYSSADLKKYPTGLNALYMADRGTIYLEGCDVAKGEAGLKYMAEIGRIFFGEKKTGFIKGNTCHALDLMGVAMSECDPRTVRWPSDFP